MIEKKKLLLILVSLLLFGCSAPENVNAYVDTPAVVSKDSDFSFTVIVENTDSTSHQLRSIDIEESFLEGIYITSTEPRTAEEYDAFGMHVFEFNKEIPANSELEIVFYSKAVKTGDYSGDLDTCIDGDASCHFGFIRMIVE